MADPNWQFFKPRALPGPSTATLGSAPALEAPPRPPPSTAVSARSTNWTYGRPEIPTTARQPFDVEMPTDRSLGSRARELGARVGPGLQRAARFAKGVGTLGAGAEVVSHLNDYKIDDPQVDSSAAGTMRALRSGDFGGAARSLGKGGLEAAMDVGSLAANTADLVVPGNAPVSTAYNKALRSHFGSQLIDNSGTLPDGGAGRGFVNPPNVNPDAPGPTMRSAQVPLTAGVMPSTGRAGLSDPRVIDIPGGQPLSDYLAGGGDGKGFDPTNGRGGGKDRRLPSDLSMLQDGQVYKTKDPVTGNTVYSGRNVKEGATIRNDGGAATGQLTNNPGSNNFVSAGDGGAAARMQDAGELQRLVAERQVREAAMPGNMRGGGLSGFGGGAGGSTMGQDLRAKTNADRSLPANAGRQEVALAAASREAALDRAERTGTATMRETGDMARAGMSADTQRYGTDVGANVNMRGQDMTLQNKLIERQIAQGQRQYERFKDDRAYGLEREKFDAGQTAANLSQQQAREGALDKKLESRFAQFDGDGKVTPESKASIASYRAGLDRSYARLGVQPHQVHPRVEEQLLTATDLLRAMRENSGVLPWQPAQLKTIDPVDLVGLQVNPKTGDRVITRADSKARGQVIPARFFETEEAHRFTLGGMRGTPTNKYDMLGAQQ